MTKKTSEDFRKEAAAADKSAADSFERSDTDGFLSQWASGLTAQLARLKAEIIDDGGTAIFAGLFEGDRRVSAKMIKTKFGSSWLLNEAEEGELIAKRGKVFLPTGEKSRILKELGLAQRKERAPAAAFMNGRGTGLSGSAWPDIFRTGDKWGSDAALLEE